MNVHVLHEIEYVHGYQMYSFSLYPYICHIIFCTLDKCDTNGSVELVIINGDSRPYLQGGQVGNSMTTVVWL